VTALRATVVVNTYNRASSLNATLDGLSRQIGAEFEVVVVNGPSTDGTDEVLAEWGDRIRVIRFDEVHLGRSRNLGIAAAAGDIVAFIDDDAVPEPDWVAELLAAYDAPDVAGAGGVVFDHTGVRLQYRYSACSRIGEPRFDIAPPFDEYLYPHADPYLYLQGTNCSFRRGALVEVGGFDETIEYYLDETELCMQLVDAGHRLVALDGAAVHHHYLPGHLRATRTTWTHPYPIVKNRTYFALSHGTATRSRGEVLLAVSEWARGVIQSGIRELREIGATDERIAEFVDEVNRGYADGVELGRSPERRSTTLPDPVESDFLPFPTIGGDHSRRYCFISGEYPPQVGGVGRFTSDTAQGLAARGHEVHVITRSDSNHRVDVERGVWVHRVPVQDRYIDGLEGSVLRHNLEHCTALYHELDRLHRRRPVSIVSAPIWNCESLLPSLDRRFPTITFVVTTIEKVTEILPSWKERPHIKALSALEAETFRRAPHLHANSTATERATRARTDGEVHLAHFGLADPSPGVRPTRDKSDGTVHLLFVGRLERRKGIDVLLQVLPGLVERFPELRVTIIGRDTPSTELDRTYREAFLEQHAGRPDILERVRFAGELPDDEVRDAYASCDVFCAPSRYESFGLVLLEAMSFGKPVVACDEGGMADLVEDNGLLVPPDDAPALAEALARLIADADLREKMGRRGRELFDQKWCLEHAVDRTDVLYGAIADAWEPKGHGIVPGELAELLVDVGAVDPAMSMHVAGVLLAPDRSPRDICGGVVRALLAEDPWFVGHLFRVVLERDPEQWELEQQLAFLAAGGPRLEVVAGLDTPFESHLGVGWRAEVEPMWSRAIEQHVAWALADPDPRAFLVQVHRVVLGRGVGPSEPDLLAQLTAGRPRIEVVRELAHSAEAQQKQVPTDWVDRVAPAARSAVLPAPEAPRIRRFTGRLRRVASDIVHQADRDDALARRLERLERAVQHLSETLVPSRVAAPPSEAAVSTEDADVSRMVTQGLAALTREQHSGFSMISEWLDVLQRKQEAMAMDLRERLPAGPTPELLPEPRILVDGGVEALRTRDGGVLRLNLGAGEKPRRGYINADVRELPGIDVVADVRRLPFDDGTLDEILSEHLVEHFRFHELRTVIFPYWKRLLAPTGRLHIVCPDLAALVAGAASGDLTMEQLAVALFGLQDYTGDDHLAMYTVESLTEVLFDVGFTEVDVIAQGRRNGGTYEMEIVAFMGAELPTSSGEGR
jgi:glycogen(starch) synthase